MAGIPLIPASNIGPSFQITKLDKFSSMIFLLYSSFSSSCLSYLPVWKHPIITSTEVSDVHNKNFFSLFNIFAINLAKVVSPLPFFPINKVWCPCLHAVIAK